MLKDILKRANERRARWDHIAYKGICLRCGVSVNIFPEDLKRYWGESWHDPRGENPDFRKMECRSARCRGKVKVMYKLQPKEAIHLADIKRR